MWLVIHQISQTIQTALAFRYLEGCTHLCASHHNKAHKVPGVLIHFDCHNYKEGPLIFYHITLKIFSTNDTLSAILVIIKATLLH
jgi:hypothetical protein